MVYEVAVVGAGIIGLSSAISIQERMKHEVRVTVIADKFTRHTVSHGAGGLFCPMAAGIDPALEERWCKDGADHFFSLASSEDAGNIGLNLVTGFDVQHTDDETPAPYLKHMLFCTKMPPSLLKTFGNHYKSGFIYTTVVVEGVKYLPYLMKRFAANGGKFVERKVESFQELSGHYDVVVNCSGLGSIKLANDSKLIPARGHILRLSAPWIKHFIHGSDSRYIMPASDTVAIGGFKQYGNWDLAIKPEESEMLLRECVERFPPLKEAKILHDWIGLRPYREPVRVEVETISCNGKPLQVVHNYGHGAFGISLSWGTGVYTAQLAEKCLRTKAKL